MWELKKKKSSSSCQITTACSNDVCPVDPWCKSVLFNLKVMSWRSFSSGIKKNTTPGQTVFTRLLRLFPEVLLTYCYFLDFSIRWPKPVFFFFFLWFLPDNFGYLCSVCPCLPVYWPLCLTIWHWIFAWALPVLLAGFFWTFLFDFFFLCGLCLAWTAFVIELLLNIPTIILLHSRLLGPQSFPASPNLTKKMLNPWHYPLNDK